MALLLRAALRSALGASFNVTHQGNAISVSVANAGKDDETPLPAVFLHSQFGTGDPSNVSGGGSANAAAIDLHIQTLDDPANAWDGALMLDDIHLALEALLRAHEKNLGASFFSWAASYRDLPPVAEQGGYYSYTRIVTVRATNVEAY